MKIVIITFHTPINYGAMLQAYATKELFRKYADQVQILDYRFSRIEKHNMITKYINWKKAIDNPMELIKNIFHRILVIWLRIKRRKNFFRFRDKYLNLSKKTFYNYDDLLLHYPKAECYIAGSDLIWNPEMAEGVNPAYFLDFVKERDTLRISYASSIGLTAIDQKYLNQYQVMLRNLDCISVREKTAVDILQKLTEKPVINVLDPTLMLNENDWNSLKSIHRIKGKYILVYCVEETDTFWNCCDHIRKYYGYQVVSFNLNKTKERSYISVHSAGPIEFVDLFKHAEVILTNSFHGVCFSLIFQKPFWCLPHTSRGSRMIDLLKLLSLDKRIVFEKKDIDFDDTINYIYVNTVLEQQREMSKKFISEALQKVVVKENGTG